MIRHCFAVLLLAATALGCAPRRQALDVAPKFVLKQDEAASGHVSVISVSRWEEYADALQPKFTLKPEDALALAVPTTMRLEEKFVDALAARFKLSPPTSSATVNSTVSDATKQSGTTTSSTAADGTTTTVVTSAGTIDQATGRTLTESEGPGSTASLTFAPPAAPDVSSIGASGVLTGGIGFDPMARYAAATALYQEVQLLNRYVRDVTIRRDSVPYVVRLQVSLLPVLRGQAYDASALLSFFSGGETPIVLPTVASVPPEPTVQDAPQLIAASFGGTGDRVPLAKRIPPEQDPVSTEKSRCPAYSPPTVVPLLVTDNMESAAHSRSLATVREFGLALGILSGNFAAGSDVESIQRSVAGLIGNDANSLLTVGRVSDNTLRVRLGAMLQAESRYAMVPRTHNVTVLLFVPRELVNDPDPDCGPRVRMIARTEITDAVRGRVLESRTPAEITLRLQAIAKKYSIVAAPETLEELRVHAQRNQYEQFAAILISHNLAKTRLAREREGLRYAEAIWLEMTNLLVGSQFSPSTFELPPTADGALPAANTRVLLLDDGKSQTTATLVGGAHLLASQLSASLKVTDSTGGREFTLPSIKVDVAENRGAMQLTFRSISPLLKNAESAKYALTISRSVPVWEGIIGSKSQTYDAVQFISVAPPVQAEPPFSVASGARIIASDAGAGTLQISFKRKPEAQGKIVLTVTGADLVAIQAPSPMDSISRVGADIVIAKDGTAQLKLNNLSVESEVEVAVRDEKGVGPAGTRIRVREVPRSSGRVAVPPVQP